MPAAVVTLSTFPRFHSGERETSRRARYNDKILQLYEKGDLHSLMSLARPAAVAVQAKRINILRAFWKAKNGIASHVLVRKHERYFKDESEVFGNATLTRSQTWLSMVETVPGSYNMVFNQRTSERPGWGRRTYLSSVAKVIRPNITEDAALAWLKGFEAAIENSRHVEHPSQGAVCEDIEKITTTHH